MAEELRKPAWQEILGNDVPDDDDLDVWAAFSGSSQEKIQWRTHPTIDDLSEIEAAIARALVHKGVAIWYDIPYHVIAELESAGFEIVKKRNKRSGVAAKKN